MSDYVVIYHANGMTSTHSIALWELIQAEFRDPTDRPLYFSSPHGSETHMFRKDMTAIHYITEAECEINSQRQAKLKKMDEDAEKEWQ